MSTLFLDGTKLLWHLERVNDWKKGKRIFPLHAEITPAGGCNYRCILCCVDYLEHKPELLERGLFLNLIRSFAKTDVRSFLLAGSGEPLLNKYVPEVLHEAKRLGLDGAITTNGLLMTKEVSEEILNTILWIRFSVQTADADKYAYLHGTKKENFDKVCTNIAQAVECKRRNNLNVTIGIQQIHLNENRHDVYALATLSKELGVDYYTVKRHSPNPEKNEYQVAETLRDPRKLFLECEDDFRRTENLSNEHFKVIIRRNQFMEGCTRDYTSCLGLPFLIQILADGGIYPCGLFYKNSEYCYGNLHHMSFEQIMRSARTVQITKEIEDHFDVSTCIGYCRHHNINNFLWKLKHEPLHVNFI